MRIKYRVGVMPGPWPAGEAGRDFFWRFVDLCEAIDQGRSTAEPAASEVARLEWRLLFQHCYRQAVE